MGYWKTKRGGDPHEMMSALQKCIRRGMEREAMEYFYEMATTSKSAFSMALNRLVVISHEDIGIANPTAVIFVATAAAQARDWYDRGKGSWKLAIANAIMLLARSAKSREADHFQCAVCNGLEISNNLPRVPDFALDNHTMAGKRMGRGVDYFLGEGTRLVPAPVKPDQYKIEAESIWRAMESSGIKGFDACCAGNPTGDRAGGRKGPLEAGNGSQGDLFD